MRQVMVMSLALCLTLAGGAQRLAASPLLIGDEEIPCSSGSNIECDRTTTEVCIRWRIVEIDISPTGGAKRACDTKVTTTEIRYVRV